MATKNSIPHDRAMQFLAVLLHFDGHVSNVMQFTEKCYTGEFHNIDEKSNASDHLLMPTFLNTTSIWW